MDTEQEILLLDYNSINEKNNMRLALQGKENNKHIHMCACDANKHVQSTDNKINNNNNSTIHVRPLLFTASITMSYF